LFVAGELSITTLRHKPAGRKKIQTEVVGPTKRGGVAKAIVRTVTAGQQVYIITPLIEESDTLGARAAMTEFSRVKKLFPKIRFGLVHGNMPANERLGVLEQFRQHDIDVLVGTTVLEVGVDVPNATLMIIEGAERFGLAQLHQLRGRVGRSSLASSCFLMTDQATQTSITRLQQVADTDDGFVLSELDLKERGAGDIYGLRQSGLPNWQLASLSDGELLITARTVAQGLLAQETPDTITALIKSANLPGVRHRE
jgi:ATP-dependent DNA helicase RecG